MTDTDLTKRYIKEKQRIKQKNGTNATYSYAIDTNSYAELWHRLHNDLGYPLKVDSRYKRAIIYNKQGLEKQIQKMITEVIEKNLKELADMVADDITIQLNSLRPSANGNMIISNRNNSTISLFATSLSKGLVNGLSKIIEDITSYDDKNRRR